LQIKHRLKTSVIISMVLLLALTSFSFLESMEYSAHGKEDYVQSQDNKQNSNCEAGEDNNNSCNNISISRHDGAGGGSASSNGNDGGNEVQVSKQNSDCEAGEDNNNSCNNFDLKEMISDRLKMLRQT
jgi:hypothetical protein